jgi:hypothetical protein
MQHFDRTCVWTRLSRIVEIAVWRVVWVARISGSWAITRFVIRWLFKEHMRSQFEKSWVATNYWFMSNNKICDKVIVQRAHEIEFMLLYKFVKFWYVHEPPTLTFSTLILILNSFYLPKRHRVMGLCHGDAVYIFVRDKLNSYLLLRWNSCTKGVTLVATICIIPPVTWVHFCESRPSTRCVL